MSERTTTVETLPHAAPRRANSWRMVATAPQPETPDLVNRRGAKAGMLIALGAGATFWGAVAAGAALLLN